MINKKKEGGFYASKVRLFLNEYDGISLEEFCKAEKVSYSKMLNCLGWTSYQYHPASKPKSDKLIKAAIERTQNHACMSYAEREQARVNLKAVASNKPLLPSLELKELVVDQADGKEKNEEELSRVTLISSKSKPTKALRTSRASSIVTLATEMYIYSFHAISVDSGSITSITMEKLPIQSGRWPSS